MVKLPPQAKLIYEAVVRKYGTKAEMWQGAPSGGAAGNGQPAGLQQIGGHLWRANLTEWVGPPPRLDFSFPPAQRSAHSSEYGAHSAGGVSLAQVQEVRAQDSRGDGRHIADALSC